MSILCKFQLFAIDNKVNRSKSKPAKSLGGKNVNELIPHAMGSKTVLDSGFQVLDSSLSVELGFWSPIVSGIPDSRGKIFLDSGFFPDSRNLESFTLGESL